MMAMLSNCSGSAGSAPIEDDFCAIANPVYISKNDVLTDATARKILGYNEYGHKKCGWSES